jgi:hypothetical protein
LLPAPISPGCRFLVNLPADAFVPFFLWSFVRDFPGQPPYGLSRKVVEFAVGLAGVVGVTLFIAGILWYAGIELLPEEGLRPFIARAQGTYYWILMFLFNMPALVYSASKSRSARSDAASDSLLSPLPWAASRWS